MSMIQKPNFYEYENNIEKYFKDLDLYYRNNRPSSQWLIKEIKYITHRSTYGFFKVPITRYVVAKKTKYIEQQYKEIKQNFNLFSIIKNQFLSNVSYNKISKNINYAYKKSSIDNFVKLDINSRDFNDNNGSYINQKTNNIIYVEIDDCYQNLRNDNNKISKYRNRMIVLHQGVINGKCINKSVFIETTKIGIKGKEIEYLADKILSAIKERYGLINPKIIVISDAARWMKKLSKILNSSHILDRFHINFNIKKCGILLRKNSNFREFFWLKYNSDFVAFLKHLIRNNMVKKAIEILELILENKLNYSLNNVENKAIMSLLKYLNNNLNLIIHNNEKWYIGSRTEAFVSHIIKKNTYKKFAVFSVKTFKFLIKNQENSNLIVEFI